MTYPCRVRQSAVRRHPVPIAELQRRILRRERVESMLSMAGATIVLACYAVFMFSFIVR